VPTIVVRNARGAPPLDGRVVKRLAQRMLTELGAEDAELGVMLTNDTTIRELNEKHRKKSKATDVLSFPMDQQGKGPSGATRLLGDVVISLDTAARTARQRRRELISEVTGLLAHGILHLVGYDHKTDAEERRMNAAAAKLIRAASARERGNGC
jgi:probable rRNA maturation factor